MLKKLTLAVGLLLAASASASTSTYVAQETFDFTNVASWDVLDSPNNIVEQVNPVGGYIANAVQVSGSLSADIASTWASEARIAFTPSGSPGFVSGALTSTQVYSPAIEPVGPVLLPVNDFDPAGTLDLQFYESFDDAADAVDQTWVDVSVSLGIFTVTNGMEDLGTLPGDGTMVMASGNNVSGGLDFYDFVVPEPGVGGSVAYLNIQTSDPGLDPIDTEIGLFDSSGVLVAFDDDGQESANGGLYSLLSFGVGDPLSGADTAPGADGLTFGAGMYTLIVGGFDTNFEDLEIGVSTIADVTPGTSSGDYDLKVTYQVPEPAAGLLALLCALAAFGIHRRR